jgi:hypothetical protein
MVPTSSPYAVTKQSCLSEQRQVKLSERHRTSTQIRSLFLSVEASVEAVWCHKKTSCFGMIAWVASRSWASRSWENRSASAGARLGGRSGRSGLNGQLDAVVSRRGIQTEGRSETRFGVARSSRLNPAYRADLGTVHCPRCLLKSTGSTCPCKGIAVSSFFDLSDVLRVRPNV